MLPVQDAAYPSPDEIRDGMLRAIRYTYARIGIDRNVLPGSDDYVRCDKLASRVGIAIANNQIDAQDASPLTAIGQGLINLAAVFGVYPRPAAGGAGSVTPAFTGAAVTIPAGFTATAPDGHKYLAAPATYASGALIPVTAVSPGASTNQLAGTILTWDLASIAALAPTATVSGGGITGGVDADGQETLRQRLLLRLAAAAVGGNWAQVVDLAYASTASVYQAFCYPAATGPAGYRVVVTALGGNRTLPASIVAIVQAYILANMPTGNLLGVTTVTPQSFDAVLKMKLPLPSSAGGNGGGFRDAAPWPAEDCKVTAYNSGTGAATVNSVASPSVGTNFGIWDPLFQDPTTGLVVGTMREYVAATVAGSTGAWVVTTQSGFGNLVGGTPLGSYVSAGAVNLVQYARSFANAVAVLGSGQLTSLPELLPRSARQPTTDVSDPSDLTSTLLDLVQPSFKEIEDLQFSLTVASGTSSPIVSPSIPTAASDPPNLLVLGSLAFRSE